jgi:hypothetical protein
LSVKVLNTVVIATKLSPLLLDVFRRAKWPARSDQLGSRLLQVLPPISAILGRRWQ